MKKLGMPSPDDTCRRTSWAEPSRLPRAPGPSTHCPLPVCSVDESLVFDPTDLAEDVTPAAALKALGQVGFGWAQQGFFRQKPTVRLGPSSMPLPLPSKPTPH